VAVWWLAVVLQRKEPKKNDVNTYASSSIRLGCLLDLQD
jgi:hypothetical protein